MNRKELAYEWLDKEFATYGASRWGEWQLQRLYDNLRGDEKWAAFLARTGTARHQLANIQLDVNVELYSQ